MRSIGTSVSSAVIGMVLAHTSVRAGTVEVPSMQGFRIAFLIATAAVLVGLALASFLPSRDRTKRPVLLASGGDTPDRQAAVTVRP